MPVDLNSPLAWKTATGDAAEMLKQLQPNILKAHVRDHLQVLFLQFKDAPEARTFLKALTGTMKSAKQHLDEMEAFKTSGTPGTAYVGVGLTFEGYKKLGIPVGSIPGNASPGPFKTSMRSDTSVSALGDPPVSAWEETFRHTIHAVVLIGDANQAAVAAKRTEINALITPKIKLLGVERGRSQTNARGDGIEHFGYIDGRSQPLFLVEDVEAERHTMDGTSVWDPAFGLGRVLVADSAAPKPAQQFGSFFVFRKLEQNVRALQEGREGPRHRARADGRGSQARRRDDRRALPRRHPRGGAARGRRGQPDPQRLRLRQRRPRREVPVPRPHPQDQPARLGRLRAAGERAASPHGPPRADLRQAHRQSHRREPAAQQPADEGRGAAVHGVQLGDREPVPVHPADMGQQRKGFRKCPPASPLPASIR